MTTPGGIIGGDGVTAPEAAAMASSSEAPASLASSDIRRHNLALIAGLLAQHGPRSRSEIAEGTGLTRGAVTALTAALLEAGVVRESDAPVVDSAQTDASTSPATDTVARGKRPPRKGRPRTALELHAPCAAILAVQLDADVATALLTTVTGETLVRVEQHHGRPMGQPDAVIDVLATVVSEALDECARLGRRALDTVVVVFAPVASEPALVLADTDLGWGVVDLLGGLRSREPRFSLEAVLSADSALAAQAERSTRPGVNDMLYLKSNSGIGGASIANGQLVTGARNLAGALGHLAIVPGGPHCLCGQRGCLVTVAGPDVVLADAGLADFMQREGLTAALAEFVRRIKADDETAIAAWEPASAWIAHTLELLTLTLDPEVIVLGGYWAELTDSIAAHYLTLAPAVAIAGGWTLPRIVPGTLGGDAALLGAVWGARERLMLDPLRMAQPAASAL